jgi:hypothetical protein
VTTRPEAGLIVGWQLTRDEVVADLRRILADIDRVRRVCGDPATRVGLGRNRDTVLAAIALIEGTA